MWNNNSVWQVHGGRNEDVPIAGPPPSLTVDRVVCLSRTTHHGWQFPAVVLGLYVFGLAMTLVIVISRMAPGQSHNDVLATVPVVQVPAVKPKAEPVILVKAPTPKPKAPTLKPKAEPAPVAQVPTVEPKPRLHRMDRMLVMDPPAKPAPVTQTPAVEPEPEPQPVVQATGIELECLQLGLSAETAKHLATVHRDNLRAGVPEATARRLLTIEIQSLQCGMTPEVARRNREYVQRYARAAVEHARRYPEAAPCRRQ